MLADPMQSDEKRVSHRGRACVKWQRRADLRICIADAKRGDREEAGTRPDVERQWPIVEATRRTERWLTCAGSSRYA